MDHTQIPAMRRPADEAEQRNPRRRQAMYVEELDDDVLAALASSEPPEDAEAYNHKAL